MTMTMAVGNNVLVVDAENGLRGGGSPTTTGCICDVHPNPPSCYKAYNWCVDGDYRFISEDQCHEKFGPDYSSCGPPAEEEEGEVVVEQCEGFPCDDEDPTANIWCREITPIILGEDEYPSVAYSTRCVSEKPEVEDEEEEENGDAETGDEAGDEKTKNKEDMWLPAYWKGAENAQL